MDKLKFKQLDISNINIKKLYGYDFLLNNLSLCIHNKDGMYDGNDEYYLMVGANILHFIAQYKSRETANILDYACGYGRNTRWLKAYFNSANIDVADIDTNALGTQEELFSVNTFNINENKPKGTYDLILVGSLLTHLNAEDIIKHLNMFYDLLAENGILLFTMHGPYVYNRIKSKEKTYGLSNEGSKNIVSNFEKNKFGFYNYDSLEGYGISMAQPEYILKLLNDSFVLEKYVARGWVKHQDVYICSKQ